ncbi:Rha family transcriptional regulator [Proteus mirabilis]|uniref:Rha family transcriptional regulator n=1 Tax=Proteus mirabilis TaxID=584 RepID=UPI001BAE9A55|nr:Rha family transcriptional regulator [Proteus mirabilis]MBS3831967.1 Rha family transcriptional regulator [Proteus mirabilis]MCT0074423.1 Rha family transcriptional regulator [Proteus mirabilis]
MSLVEIKKFDLLTSSSAIADGVKKKHKTVIQLIRHYVDDLNEFGRVAFEMRSFDTDGGRQKQQVALLNEHQATLLITYMRNNDVVRAFKKRLVSEFFKMLSALAAKKLDRNTSRLEYKPMTDAVKKSREEQGKTISPHHFSNEADLINRIVLGMTSAKFRVHNEIGKKEPIRDYLTPEQIHCVTELQRANTVFISMGWDFEQRKDELTKLFNKNHKQPLLDEMHRLAA